MATSEQLAADEERVAEAGIKAEEWLDYLLCTDREDALEVVRDFLQLIAWGRILLERIHEPLDPNEGGNTSDG
jgi:hypothetical protein